ncbi:hypothetical protein ACLIR7_09750 [Nitratireductor aquimarinus]|uniref:hypothetical protein n=1 Tax=Nitratireductor aquimarinus TaxID=889300 RepID=UPI00398E9BEF
MMRTRTYMTGMLALPINAMLFGAGAVLVLSVPALFSMAEYLLPAVIVTSIVLTVPLAWWLAPMLRSRNHYPEFNRKW